MGAALFCREAITTSQEHPRWAELASSVITYRFGYWQASIRIHLQNGSLRLPAQRISIPRRFSLERLHIPNVSIHAWRRLGVAQVLPLDQVSALLRSATRRIMRCATRRRRSVKLAHGCEPVSTQCLETFADAAEPVRRQCLRDRLQYKLL